MNKLALSAALTLLLAPTVVSPAHAAPVDTLTEGFDDITTLSASGWSLQNVSQPIGITNWFQGNSAVFTAQTGADTAYIGANFNNTSGSGTISNWLLTPELTLSNGSQVIFWTRASSSGAYADRLEVRLSTAGAGTDVGGTATSTGTFTRLLTVINPDLDVSVYPTVWTRYSLTVSGLPQPTTGRIGFRYFVTDGGPSGTNSNYIGIDTVSYAAAPTVTAITPDHGPVEGGTAVTVSGERFSVADLVTVNGVACTSVNVVSPSSLTCTTSPGSEGTGTVQVTNSAGIVGSGGTFTYGSPGPLAISPATVDFASTAVGTAVLKTVTVRNTGAVAVTPTQVALAGADVALRADTGGQCAVGVPIPGGEECYLDIRWSPTGAGQLAGSLTIASADGNASVQMIGTATLQPPAPVATPVVSASKKKVTVAWAAATGAASYQVTLSGTPAKKKAKKAKKAAAARLAAKKVSKTTTTAGTTASFKVKLKPKSKVRVCVTAVNAGGLSSASCGKAKVPK